MIFDGIGGRRRLSESILTERWSGHLLHLTREPAKELTEESLSSPAIRFQTLHIDIGDVPVNEEGELFTFNFSNVGKSDLRILSVKPDCDCMEVIRPYDPIPSGQSSNISLRYKIPTNTIRGQFQHRAEVQTSDPFLNNTHLTISGNSANQIKISPSIIDFGRVVAGTETTRYCYLYSLADEDISITDIISSTPNAKCRLVPMDSLGENSFHSTDPSHRKMGTHAIEIKLTPPRNVAAPTPLSENIVVKFSNSKTRSIPFIATSVGMVVAEPSSLIFNLLKTESKLISEVQLRSPLNKNFRVLSVEDNNSRVPISFEVLQRFNNHILVIKSDRERVISLASSGVTVRVAIDGITEPQILNLPVIVIDF